jgi:RHS repeat-associated protein
LSVTDKINGIQKGTNAYTYDILNRVTKLTQSGTGTDGTQDYSYDSTNQLTTATHTTQTDEAYSYDANGNRTSGGSSAGTNNQLLTDGTYNYEYDGEGNRTKRTEIGTGKVTEYIWDYRNRLTSVLFKDAGGNVTKTIQYTYDVNDRRIGKQIDGVTTERYVYDGSNIALVFDGTGTQTHRYLYGTGVDQVLADERGGTVVWALSDNQGTVRDLVDGNGTVLNHVVYDSFGQVQSQSDAGLEFRYGYTGREQDGETGLDYYRARYYDASNGRFISEDPIGFSAGDSNLTRYVGNNPTNYNDPSGLSPVVAPNKPVIPNKPGVGKPTGRGFGTNNFPKQKPPTIPLWLIRSGGAAYIFWRIVDAGPTASNDMVKPNPNCDEERRKKCKENGGRILYRGDGRSPIKEKIFNTGFVVDPENTMDNFERHVNDNPYNSIFISTSKKESFGIDFATNRGKQSGYLYEICDPGGGIDAGSVYGKKQYKGKHKYKDQAEVGFRYRILAKNIITATSYNKKR